MQLRNFTSLDHFLIDIMWLYFRTVGLSYFFSRLNNT